MSWTLKAAWLLVLPALWFAGTRSPSVGPSMVTGTTLQWSLQKDDYRPLGGVRIEVFRKTPSGGQAPLAGSLSKEDGTYELEIPSGAPATLVFYYAEPVSESDRGKFVPEMQNVSTAPGDRQHVNPAMISVEDYNRAGGITKTSSLYDELKSMLRSVPEDSEVAGHIRDLMRRNG